MATVKALITALLFGGNQATYRLECSRTEVKNSIFHWASLPIRRTTSKLLHPYRCLESLDLDEDPRQSVATWPTYANNSFIQLTGYAYALPACAKDPIKQHGVFERCAAFLGVRLSPDQGFMHEHYLSHSVSGAQITLLTGVDEAKLSKGVSGEYGHFQSFVGHDEPVGSLDFRVSTSGCPLNDWLRSEVTTSTAQVLPPCGVTIVSDVDDVLRECEVWNPKQMLLNTFDRPFQPWSDEPWLNTSKTDAAGMIVEIAQKPLGSMPRVYQHWASSVRGDHQENIHFHYVTEAPEMSHQFYVEGISQYYPPGSFDFRPMVLDTYNKFMNSRYDNIRRLIETFPNRNFILVGDTSTPSMLESYRKLSEEFDQVQCILVRDASATEPANWFAHDLSRYPRGRFIVFNTPNELMMNPNMNVTRLLQGFSGANEKSLSGCGGLLGHENEERHVRKARFLESAKTGLNRYVTCWLLTLSGDRPSKDCYFDRRGLLRYAPVREISRERERLEKS